jgi:hypothetical protein
MTRPKKHREWTILYGETIAPTIIGPAIAYAENIKVIEYAAVEELREENERLRGFLERIDAICGHGTIRAGGIAAVSACARRGLDTKEYAEVPRRKGGADE